MDITSQVISDFRVYYPEFADSNDWSNTLLERVLEAGDQDTGSTRWGQYVASPASFKARGLYAYAAHKAVLAKAAQKAVAAGGAPSAASQVTSKTVGDESASYAAYTPNSAGQAAGIGDLSTTMYGQEFMRLRKRAGMGAATTGSVKL